MQCGGVGAALARSSESNLEAVAGGCNLNRPIGELLMQAGFGIERVETGYGTGPRPMTFMYEGVARKSA